MVYRCVPIESNVCLRDNICLSGTSVFISHFLFSPCISVVKAWARASGFNSASMNAQKHIPHPQKKYNHLFFWRGSKCICISPPARTVPHCLEWLEGKQIGVFQLSRMLNAERRCMNWRKISCKLWCYVERICWKQGHRSEEIGTQHWALWASFQVCAAERLTADPAQDSVPVLC